MAASSGPLVVHESGTVLDACDSASMRGVGAGMPLGQARALLSGGRFVELDRETFEEARARWLDRLVPFADAIEPLAAHEALIDLSAHPRPREIVPHVLRSVAEAEPRVSGGAARSAWIARLAVDHRGDAVADPARFLAPLPVSLLTPVEPRHRERLRALGGETVGDVQAIPPDALRRQFGTAALTIRAAALGQVAEPVRSLYPPDSLGGYVPIDGGTGSAETLEATLDRLSAELGAELAHGDRQTAGPEAGEGVLEAGHRPAVAPLRAAAPRPAGAGGACARRPRHPQERRAQVRAPGGALRRAG